MIFICVAVLIALSIFDLYLTIRKLEEMNQKIQKLEKNQDSWRLPKLS